MMESEVSDVRENKMICGKVMDEIYDFAWEATCENEVKPFLDMVKKHLDREVVRGHNAWFSACTIQNPYNLNGENIIALAKEINGYDECFASAIDMSLIDEFDALLQNEDESCNIVYDAARRLLDEIEHFIESRYQAVEWYLSEDAAIDVCEVCGFFEEVA